MTNRNKNVNRVARKGARTYNTIMNCVNCDKNNISGGGINDLFKKKEKVKVNPIDAETLEEKVNRLMKKIRSIQYSLTTAYMENYHMGTHEEEIRKLEKEKDDAFNELAKTQRLGLEIIMKNKGNTPVSKDVNLVGIPPEVSDIISDYSIDYETRGSGNIITKKLSPLKKIQKEIKELEHHMENNFPLPMYYWGGQEHPEIKKNRLKLERLKNKERKLVSAEVLKNRLPKELVDDVVDYL